MGHEIVRDRIDVIEGRVETAQDDLRRFYEDRDSDSVRVQRFRQHSLGETARVLEELVNGDKLGGYLLELCAKRDINGCNLSKGPYDFITPVRADRYTISAGETLGLEYTQRLMDTQGRDTLYVGDHIRMVTLPDLGKAFSEGSEIRVVLNEE